MNLTNIILFFVGIVIGIILTRIKLLFFRLSLQFNSPACEAGCEWEEIEDSSSRICRT